MNKLYPPIIESTVSACYQEKGMVKFTIPFVMNRAVGISQIVGFELKIKTVQNGNFLYTIQTVDPADYKINENESYVIFYLKDLDNKLKIGQFYKVQLAYISLDENEKNKWYNQYVNGIINLEEYEEKIKNLGIVGFYSSTGIIKYTTKPKLYINEFSENTLNEYTHTYTGYYSQENGDNTEKVYSYWFNIYDNNGQIILTSNEQIHNNALDTNSYISTDNYTIMKDLKYYTVYYIDYNIMTVNKMILSSPKYKIIQRETIDPEIFANINVELNFENSYIDISLVPIKDFYMQEVFNIIDNISIDKYKWLLNIQEILSKGFTDEQAHIIYNLRENIKNIYSQYNLQTKNNFIKQYYTTNNATGAFVLTRSDETSNYSNWEELTRFKLYETLPEGLIFKDFTIQQGVKYKYSIQQYNDYGLFSKRLYSNIIIADFEDAFLYDGNQQLKIRYNPKIQKFTNTVLESKQDTLGGKFPFIFRNGNVNYNEFSFGGLISYLSDNEFLFLSKDFLNLSDEPHRHYTQASSVINYQDNLGENITRERLFKMEVLKWLNNGQPKLFKSPTEGNFLIRLMKVSLTPENKLGRMLHNFSCTAYEIEDFNISNLQKLKILKNLNIDNERIKFFTKDLSSFQPNAILNTINEKPILINGFKCEDMFFGDELNLIYEDGQQETIKIGLTGNYEINQSKLISSLTVKPRYNKMIIIENEQQKNILWNSLYKKTIKNEYEKLKELSECQIGQSYYQISNNPLKGFITFSYKSVDANNFANIKSISYDNPTYKQFIGKHDILKEIKNFKYTYDIKKQFVNWYYIKVERRPIDKIIRNNNNNNTLYYYGLDEYSEKLKFSEIKYPIGLRVYEPGKYYKNIGDVDFTNEEFDALNPNYYMYGKYELVSNPIGEIIYEPGKYYIRNNDNYELSLEDFNPTTVYYQKTIDKYQIIHYEIVSKLTNDKNYKFKPNKFYRKTENNYYTLSNNFVEEWELNSTKTNWIKNKFYYYEFKDYPIGTEGCNYHNAYATINEKYLYKNREYYMKINLIGTNGKDEIIYMKCNSSDFNIHGINENYYSIENGYPEDKTFSVEYDTYNKETIKYYKIKPILPHYLHQIGTNWNISNHYDNNVDTYAFEPTGEFIDFYNNETIYDVYEPWIEINGKLFNVEDTIIFNQNNLKDLEMINSFMSGNGVIVEVGYQLKNINYLIEDSVLNNLKNNYENKLSILEEKYNILLEPEHKDYINLSEAPSEKQLQLYNSYINENYENAVKNAYQSLLIGIAQRS